MPSDPAPMIAPSPSYGLAKENITLADALKAAGYKTGHFGKWRDDIGERTDLATRDKARRDELLTDLLAWIHRAEALLPTERNPVYAGAAADGADQKRRGKRKQNSRLSSIHHVLRAPTASAALAASGPAFFPTRRHS